VNGLPESIVIISEALQHERLTGKVAMLFISHALPKNLEEDEVVRIGSRLPAVSVAHDVRASARPEAKPLTEGGIFGSERMSHKVHLLKGKLMTVVFEKLDKASVLPNAILVRDRPGLESPAMGGLSGTEDKRKVYLHYACLAG